MSGVTTEPFPIRIGPMTSPDSRSDFPIICEKHGLGANTATGRCLQCELTASDQRVEELMAALDRLRNGPDTLTPVGLRIVNDALLSTLRSDSE